MNFDFDVVVVGAGPVGSTIAYYLSFNNINVALIDEKKQIGFPLQCAGLLSGKIFEVNQIPENIILNKVEGAFIHSKHHTLDVEKEKDVAYVIDRVSYDEFLLNRAFDNGVKFINHKVVDVDCEKGITYLENNEKIMSKVVIGCDGYNSLISEIMGNTQNNFPASQVLAKISDEDIAKFRNSQKSVDDYVDIYLLEDALPGFIWIIPIKNEYYRIGMFSNQSSEVQFELLEEFFFENFDGEILEKYEGFIPIFNKNNRMVKGRTILIGDAAGHIKPTSGGGLSTAFDACHIASNYVVHAVHSNDLNRLKEYQKEFENKYLDEFSYQSKIQKSLGLLCDDDLDYLFLKLKENDCEKIISEYGEIDTQSVLVKELIKRGLISKILPSVIFNKISKLFQIR